MCLKWAILQAVYTILASVMNITLQRSYMHDQSRRIYARNFGIQLWIWFPWIRLSGRLFQLCNKSVFGSHTSGNIDQVNTQELSTVFDLCYSDKGWFCWSHSILLYGLKGCVRVTVFDMTDERLKGERLTCDGTFSSLMIETWDPNDTITNNIKKIMFKTTA